MPGSTAASARAPTSPIMLSPKRSSSRAGLSSSAWASASAPIRAPAGTCGRTARPPAPAPRHSQSGYSSGPAALGPCTVPPPGPAPRRPRRQARCKTNPAPACTRACHAARPPAPAPRSRQSGCHSSAAPPGRRTVSPPGPAPRPPRRRSRSYATVAPSGWACLAARPTARRPRQTSFHAGPAAPGRGTAPAPGPAPPPPPRTSSCCEGPGW
eukprot:scaffold3216_cov286-Prasinococcus_capsulatus_cf.AAC.1